MHAPPLMSDDAWELFCASAYGHMPTINKLVERAPALLHVDLWYEFPLHFAVRGGHAEAVEYLLQAGSNPARSNFTYTSWQKLLPLARSRGFDDVYEILIAEMRRRFQYDPAVSSLLKCIERRDAKATLEILDQNPALVHAADEHGNRPLHWAVLTCQLPLIDTLLRRGADIDAYRADMQTPIHLAIEGDYWHRFPKNGVPDSNTLVGYLLGKGAEYTLSVAAHLGDCARISELLKQNPEAACQLNPAQRSPLAHAAKGGHLEATRLLLDHGADPNLAEHCAARGHALFSACDGKHVDVIKLLLERGADPNAEVDSSGNCLSIAEHRPTERSKEVVSLLRAAGARAGHWTYESVEDIRGLLCDQTADPCQSLSWPHVVCLAVNSDSVELVELFVDRFGKKLFVELTPQQGWLQIKSQAMLDRLLELGMDIDRPDWFGQTHLHLAAENDWRSTLRLLLDANCQVDPVDHLHGTTPLGVAAAKGHLEIAKQLLAVGAQVTFDSLPDWAQPINQASEHGHSELAKYLSQLP